MVSTNEETVLSNSYSTLAGINLAMSNMVTTANEDASVQVAESGTTATAASQEQDAAKVADTTDYSKIAVSQVTSDNTPPVQVSSITWTTGLQLTFQIDFGSWNNARYFFNTGSAPHRSKYGKGGFLQLRQRRR